MGDHDGKGHRGRPIPVGCGHFFILLYSGEKIFHSHGASPCSAPHLLPHLPHPGCEHRKYLAPQLLPPSLHSLPEHWDTLGPPGQQRLDSAGGHGLDPLLRTPGFPEHPASILTGPPNVLSGCLLSAASTVRILMDFVVLGEDSVAGAKWNPLSCPCMGLGHAGVPLQESPTLSSSHW